MYVMDEGMALNFNILSWVGKVLPPSVTAVYGTFQPIGCIIIAFIVYNRYFM
jgi:hypothetical protein